MPETQLPASSVDYRRGDDSKDHNKNNRRTPVSVEPLKHPRAKPFLLHPVCR